MIMKYTFEKAQEKLLSIGFKKIEDKPQKDIIILGTFGLNYCECCKRCKGKICFYRDIIDGVEDDIWIYFETEDESSGNDPFTRETLYDILRELGIKSKLC